MDNSENPTHVRNWKNYAIFLLLIVVGILLVARGCDRQAPGIDPREIAYQDTIRILKQQNATIQAQKDSVYTRVGDRIKRDSITIKVQDQRIAAARKREREAEAKISELTKQQHPEVVAALQAKDTTILELTAKVDSLQASNDDFKKQLAVIQHLDIDEDKIQARMMQECEDRREEIMADLAVANKKAEKVPVLKRVVLWLGVALAIETAILAIK